MTAGRWVRLLRFLAGVVATLLVGMLALSLYLWDLSRSLPDLETAPQALNAARTSIVYAADGTVVAEWHGEQDRKLVPLASMPKTIRDAVVAAEDPRFFEHDGIDTGAVWGALSGADPAGASRSTITLQLVRLLFADAGAGGVTRKVQQALLAYQLEAKVSKERVLEAYLNLVYFGNGRYGVESAARGYFGKSAQELTLSEAAALAGVIRSPSKFAPTADLPAARTRRDAVLTRMRDLGLISSEQEVASHKEPLTLVPPADAAAIAPYFVEYVKQQLIDRLGSRAVFTGGLRITTTLQPALQRVAEEAVRGVLTEPGDPEAALVSLDPRDGRILALVGGRDFATEQYNLAVQGRRQPGSAFKPFVLVAALEKGISPDRVFDTSPYTVRVKDGVWRVENYENAYTTGQLTLRAATDWSVNAVFARLIMEVGPEKVVDTARRMGITSPLEPNPAIALGGLSKGVSPLEMASAFGTLAAGGMHAEPVAVLKVENDRGEVLYEAKAAPERAVSQAVAAQASGMLHDVVERGTGTAARFGGWAAGKTGTTQSYRDAWFVGYTGTVSTAVWVGYRAAQVDMLSVHGIKVTGGSFPAMIWSRYMSTAPTASAAPPAPALGGAPGGETGVEGLVRVRICRASFLQANPRCPDVYEVDLEPALVPAATCTLH
ncbi:MAG TPA: PBP1A family penicillin-binding protein [Coriobacteriia bacterium]